MRVISILWFTEAMINRVTLALLFLRVSAPFILQAADGAGGLFTEFSSEPVRADLRTRLDQEADRFMDNERQSWKFFPGHFKTHLREMLLSGRVESQVAKNWTGDPVAAKLVVAQIALKNEMYRKQFEYAVSRAKDRIPQALQDFFLAESGYMLAEKAFTYNKPSRWWNRRRLRLAFSQASEVDQMLALRSLAMASDPLYRAYFGERFPQPPEMSSYLLELAGPEKISSLYAAMSGLAGTPRETLAYAIAVGLSLKANVIDLFMSQREFVEVALPVIRESAFPPDEEAVPKAIYKHLAWMTPTTSKAFVPRQLSPLSCSRIHKL